MIITRRANTRGCLRVSTALIAATACALLLSACGGSGSSDKSASNKKLIVATDTAFVPFEFKKDGEYVGFDIDLWTEVAKEIDREFKLQPMDFNGILPALQTGQVDVALAGITITEDRKKAIGFSDGYYDSGFTLMVAEDSSIKGPEDLKGKTLAVKTGTSSHTYAKEEFKGTKLRLFPNIDNAYLELQTGRVDAAMHDTPNVLYYIAKNKDAEVKTVGKTMMAQEYGIAFPKGSKLIPEVNEALATIKADGRYNQIYKEWFGSEPKQ